MYRALLPSLILGFLTGCPGVVKESNDDTGSDDSTPDESLPLDSDGDGSPDTVDCAPDDPNSFPGGIEVCDGADNNCNGTVDDNATDASTFYTDSDGDGYGDPLSSQTGCEAPLGTVSDNTDCDDTSASSYPGGTELCDSLDNDCDNEVDEDAADTLTWYMDMDGDGYGDPLMATTGCDEKEGLVSDNTDCLDTDATVNPGATEICNGVDDNCDFVTDTDAVDQSTWYLDADSDGFGLADSTMLSCEQPVGYAMYSGDCNDSDPMYNPGATEADCTDPNDYNCDGSVGYVDNDGDGYAACEDCDDSVNTSYPGATEYCNSVDDNCDGSIDEDSSADAAIWYADTDGDGYGDANATMNACSQPANFVADATDCDDTASSSYPGATEYCNDVDDNCDGEVDEDSAADGLTWYLDGDGDGYGDVTTTTTACTQPSGYVSDGTDCDDTVSTTNPGADEYCNGVDDDCTGTADEPWAVDVPMWYIDDDGDGYGVTEMGLYACDQPSGFAAAGGDCNDRDAEINPAAQEKCDGADNNCDGEVDEDSAEDASTWYADSDGDGYGDPSSTAPACYQPSGYSADNTDCDDTAATSYPGATEYCNGEDDNCDGEVDEDSAADALIMYADVDRDGYGDNYSSRYACALVAGHVFDNTDCNDGEVTIYPGAIEYCNGNDDDCNGSIDDSAVDAVQWYQDADSDGYGEASVSQSACTMPSGYVQDATDCDDTAASVNPGADEYCNNIDDDCDSTIDEGSAVNAATWYEDADSDSFGNSSVSQNACTQPSGYVSNSTDCDDTLATVYPGAAEYCNSIDDSCDGSVDENPVDGTTYYNDGDSDGYGDPDLFGLACTQPAFGVLDNTDCDDSDADINPAATEVCDNVDNNCDSQIDEGFEPVYYQDLDGDGFGNPDVTMVGCDGVAPVGYRLDNTDCDDTSVRTNPYAYDSSSDSLDSDCDGSTSPSVTYSAGPVGDDVSATVSVSSFTFPFCGTNYGTGGSTIYMISNGRLTLGHSDTDLSESLSDLTGDRTVAPYWDDLNLSASYGGLAYYAEFPDAMAFHWVNAPEYLYYSTSTRIDFSAILFDDGRILLTYGNNTLTNKDALSGWACAPSSAPSETNLSAISYLEGYWGYGLGTEKAIVELFTGSTDPHDLANTAVRFCSNADGTLSHCEE